MANRTQKLTPKPFKPNTQGADAMKRAVKKTPKKPVKSVRRETKPLETSVKMESWLSSMLAVGILSGSAALIALFVWISLIFILNPEKLSWLNNVLPEWAKISSQQEHPQTLSQIKLNLKNKGQIAGEILPLDGDVENSFLLPVYKQRANCQSDCKYVVELRVYQLSQDTETQSSTEKYYHLATQLPITGPEEYFVIAPLVDATSENQGSSISLPLSEVKRFEGNTSSGVWFYCKGQRMEGTNAIAYGHILHYNPERSNLQLMLSWTSPNGQLPKWQQVTNNGTKELIVDQTVGLEPQLRVYQVQPVNSFLDPIQLEEISLKPPELKDSAYQDAVSIARSGLWTPAFEWLQFIKKQQKEKMPAAAQAQIDLIRLHSQLTKIQADKSWASPSQQVLADLIDGRWEKALQVFEASPENAQEIATLLKADEGRLWNRTSSALQVNPNRPEVQAWAALILAAGQGQSRANSWLEEAKITPDNLTHIQSLLRQLNGEVTPISSTHPSRIIGSVQPISSINSAEWLQLSKTDLKAVNNQWYQVEVSAFNDGKRWLNSPFGTLNLPKTSPEKFIWSTLGINSDAEIQIVVWLANGEQQTTTATIKGVQLRDGVLRLLAAGQIIPQSSNAVQPHSLALTNAALEWVQPSPITVEQLEQQDPQRVKTILPTIWRSLQQSGNLPTGTIPNLQQMRQKLGYWPIQEIDLTGNNKPETVLTISADAIAALNQSAPKIKEQDKNLSRPRTLILSDDGKLIYTDFSKNSQHFLTAIAKISDGASLALLVENGDRYSLKRWSENHQRFE
ncbi:hypothetical protein [Tolypothrix sp. VBCCA 56010]|uniref:hypothetical protein n=1 Tax=Tolypothrix sp. VBCCA 56010 TaxID=3137731 RepID=UPI003D7CEAEB